MAVRIIKANSTEHASPGELFNFVDLHQQSAAMIEAAQREAEQIIANAQREAGDIREQAYAEARTLGREEGLRDAESAITTEASQIAERRIAEQLSTALPALCAAATALQSERDGWIIRWEQTAVRLGVSIAEKLIRRQLASRPEIGTEMIADALRLASGQAKLTIYLHPDDLAAWGDRASQIVQSLTACADTTLVPDDRNIRGGCRIETRHGEIDARVESMLHRIVDELLDG